MSSIKTVDARNTYCPGPLMELIMHMKQASVGDVLELLSTDKGTATDVPQWCKKSGHELLDSQQVGDTWHIKIRKTK